MAKDETNQLNLTVVALVALVAIVGLVALVMNSASIAKVAAGSAVHAVAEKNNVAGSATAMPLGNVIAEDDVPPPLPVY